uniref:CUB domain-containing protein n=1 Tax=Daphnia galeata TaxID=27404 RepID=A0A8J2WNV0_9CRUS|nr:unnamed protein product [Daphnia galeata]
MTRISSIPLLCLLFLALSSPISAGLEDEDQLLKPHYFDSQNIERRQSLAGRTIESSDHLRQVSSPVFQLCRDQPGQTAASNGTIQSILLSGQTAEQKCRFTIIAPPDYQIQMSCSVMVIVPYTNSYLTLVNIIDDDVVKLFPSRIYTLKLNEMSVSASYRSSDRFECKWTTVPSSPPATSEFKLCRHWQTTLTSGIIRPLDRDSGPSRSCSFWLQAPIDHQIQMVCSLVDLTITSSSLKILSAADASGDAIVPNRIYSSIRNSLTLYS